MESKVTINFTKEQAYQKIWQRYPNSGIMKSQQLPKKGELCPLCQEIDPGGAT